jgi:hypothetical protein
MSRLKAEICADHQRCWNLTTSSTSQGGRRVRYAMLVGIWSRSVVKQHAQSASSSVRRQDDDRVAAGIMPCAQRFERAMRRDRVVVRHVRCNKPQGCAVAPGRRHQDHGPDPHRCLATSTTLGGRRPADRGSGTPHRRRSSKHHAVRRPRRASLRARGSGPRCSNAKAARPSRRSVGRSRVALGHAARRPPGSTAPRDQAPRRTSSGTGR